MSTPPVRAAALALVALAASALAVVPASAAPRPAPPSVTGISVTSGPLAGGATAVVTGTNFVHVSRVLFGTTPARGLRQVSSGRLSLIVPAGRAGVVDVRVQAAGGTSAPTTRDRFTYIAAPTAPVVTATDVVAGSGPNANPQVRLRATACGRDACYAIGNAYYAQAERAIIETLSGGTWTARALPLPADAASPNLAELRALDCGPDTCTAVGAYYTRQGHTLPLIETLSDGTWTAGAGAVPAGTVDGYYSDLACNSGHCVAFGATPSGVLLASYWPGTRWAASRVALPPGVSERAVYRTDLACGGGSYCVFIGSYLDGGTMRYFGSRFNGHTWTPSVLPSTSDGRAIEIIIAAACPTSTQCVAVGAAQPKGDGPSPALVATDTNGTWTTALVPLPSGAAAGASSSLDAVACAGGRCTAVGRYGTNGDGLVETLVGGRWAATSMPRSAGSSGRLLVGAACTTPERCVAVGTDGVSGGDTVGVLGVHTDGGNASRTVAPPPGYRGNASLSAVACNTGKTCIAVASIAGQSTQWLLTIATS